MLDNADGETMSAPPQLGDGRTDGVNGEIMSALSAAQPGMTFVVAPERRLARSGWP